MIKHDKRVHQKKGEPEKCYAPRQSLADRIAACREMEAKRQQTSHRPAIEASETDEDQDILAAVSKADCVSGGTGR